MLPHWTENSIDVNGVKIHYIEIKKPGAYKAGDGRPVLVLAHGFSDHGLCWLPVARELESEYDLILPDARGHGRSRRVQPGEKVDNAADLAGLIQALGLKDPIVGGHSMGGNTTATLAARFPGLARALILEDPGWRDPQPPKEEAAAEKEPPRNPWFEWLSSLGDQTIEQVMEKGRADNPTWPEVEIFPWAESKKLLDTHIFQVQGQWMNWTEQAQGIKVPALLLTADPEKGAIVTPETAQRAKELSPSIREVNVPGVGHCIRRENFAAFMEAVRGFLKEIH